MRPMPWQALLAALMLVVSLPALAEDPAGRLEADLRALFADDGRLEIGEVSAAMLGDRVTARDLHFIGAEGQQLWLDRYVVSGDYDSPDEVRLEGLRLEVPGREQLQLTAGTLLVDEPSMAVLPLNQESWPQGLRVAGLDVEALAVEFAGQDLGESLGEGQGRVDIARLQASGLSREAIDSLELHGIEGQAEGEGEFDRGTFSLAFARLDGLRGLDRPEGEQQLDRLELRDLAMDSERLAATLASLEVDGDMRDGEGGMRLEALDLDLARMIALAPAEERTRLRMASNLLTGGSGQLRLDARSTGRWEAQDGLSRLFGGVDVTAQQAFGWSLDADLPVRLPEGVEPSNYLAELDSLEDVTLLGGEIETTLTELGLFGRMPAVMAASQGVSEADFLAMARTQAKGFGTMLGPEFGAILDGLVDMMAGKARELAIHLTLPADSELGTLSADPLGLPSKLSMRVETR